MDITKWRKFSDLVDKHNKELLENYWEHGAEKMGLFPDEKIDNYFVKKTEVNFWEW